MQQEFLDHYERELNTLYERAEVFAAEYPGLAARLGGLVRNRMDPGLAGLLEGAAFLAARVQLKLSSEFSTFTTALLEQLMPGYLAPVPSAMLVQAQPDFRKPDLAMGQRFEPGSYLDAMLSDGDRRMSCRFRLSAPLELWPIELERAEYTTGASTLQALGLEVLTGTAAGLRLRFVRRGAVGKADPEGKADGVLPMQDLAKAGLSRLNLHLDGPTAEMSALYEQVFGRCKRVTLRWLDAQGDPRFRVAPAGLLGQIGFDQDESFFPEETRFFEGFGLLRDFHILPEKFMGFRLLGLQELLAHVPSASFDLLFEFDQADGRLAPLLGPRSFRLFAAPAINLFQERCARVRVDEAHSEYLLTPQPSPAENYEVHSLTRVRAHFGDGKTTLPVWPVHALPGHQARPEDALYFSLRRRPRRVSRQEMRRNPNRTYTGSEALIALHQPVQSADEAARPARGLQADALCTNRHLPTHLRGGAQGVKFRLVDDTQVGLTCLAGPTPPRLPLALQDVPHAQSSVAGASSGARLWQLLNCLKFNQLGLTDRNADEPAGGLRDVLALFADLSDAISARHVQGLIGCEVQPRVRSMRHADGFAPVRGLQVTLTFEDQAFEGTGFAILGAVLDRFLADNVQINSFTQTVIRSRARGDVLRFPPRSGTGPVL